MRFTDIRRWDYDEGIIDFYTRMNNKKFYNLDRNVEWSDRIALAESMEVVFALTVGASYI